MASSSELGAGDVKLLKDQYNDLRDDVLDTATGHDHTGVAGHGKQLSGPDAIVDRTRSVFIPVVGGYNDTDSVALTNFTYYGLEIIDAKECWGYGYWIVPSDFVSGLTVKAVVVADASGNIWSENRTRYGKCGEAHNVHTANTGLAAEACVADANTCVALTALAGAEVGDIVRITFTRLADQAEDTIDDHANITGWVAQYTADS